MKLFTIIQGHTKHIDFMLKHYQNTDNVIWATDESAPIIHLNKIKKSNIVLVTIPDIYCGYGNINLQAQTTYQGLLKAQELGATHCIKIRSDLYFSPINKFFDIIKDDDKLHHLAYLSLHNYPYISKRKKDIEKWIKENNFKVEDIAYYSYIIDFINYGRIENMLLFWNLPIEKKEVKINATHKLMFNYLIKKDLKLNLSFDYLTNFFNFFVSELREKSINMVSLKHNYNMNTFGIDEQRGKGFYLG